MTTPCGTPNGIHPPSADVLVVGGGLAGLYLARRMAATHSGSILVVEAGPDAGHGHLRWEHDREKADRIWLDPASDPYFRRPYHPTATGFDGISGLRGRLGGRALYWGGVALPIEPWALADGSWPAEVVADLTMPRNGEPPLYDSVVADLEKWAGGPLCAGRGFELGGRRFTEVPRAVLAEEGSPRWRAWSPLEDLHDPERPGAVSVRCDLQVVAVVTGPDGAARGVLVEHDGERTVIGAGRVVLAAGTVENSRLVLQALPPDGATGTASLPGLVDKLAQGFVTAFAPAAVPEQLRPFAEAGGLFMAPGPAGSRSNLFLRVYTNDHGLTVVDCYLMGEQTRDPSGRVWCEPGPELPWPTFAAGHVGEADRRLAGDQRRELRRMHQLLGGQANRTAAPLVFEDGFGSADLAGRITAGDSMQVPGQPVTYSFPLGWEQHEAGTLPLGGAVVDERAQVRAVPGLYVCGPATFPRTGAANPALTVLALAARLAGELTGARR
ncbi:GMC oxidoreductase [Actinacidiphila sp. bgisy144]|uniref:GMC oxidoreductase n=1 Tax=Actinacidiphila sp. bgisy144 TaxID=3413791 RepID=UPI003EBB2E6E